MKELSSFCLACKMAWWVRALAASPVGPYVVKERADSYKLHTSACVPWHEHPLHE